MAQQQYMQTPEDGAGYDDPVAEVEAVEAPAIQEIDADQGQRHADKDNRMRAHSEQCKAEQRDKEHVEASEEAAIGGGGSEQANLLHP